MISLTSLYHRRETEITAEFGSFAVIHEGAAMREVWSHGETRPSHPTQRFWLRWLKASAIGAAPGIGLALAGLFVPQLVRLAPRQPELVQPLAAAVIVVLLLPGILLGLGLGIGQRRAASSLLGNWWPLVNTLGFAAFWLVCLQTATDRLLNSKDFLAGSIVLGLAVFFYLVVPQLLCLGTWRLPVPDKIDGTAVEPILIFLFVLAVLPLLAVQSLLRAGLELPYFALGDIHFSLRVLLLVLAAAVQICVAGYCVSHRQRLTPN